MRVCVFQRKIYEKSINRNIIVCLPTGTGKTLIAINLIKNKLHQTFGPFPSQAKRTVFLCPTRELVDQQYVCIAKQVKPATVCCLHGEKRVDFCTMEQWNNYFQNNQIIVLTPQVLVGMCFYEVKSLLIN